MKCLTVVLSLLILGTPAGAQHAVDSLQLLTKHARSQGKTHSEAILLSTIGWVFYNEGRYDSAYHYFTTSLTRAKGIADDSLFSSVHINLGTIFKSRGIPDSSLYYYGLAQHEYERLKYKHSASLAEVNLALVYKDLGLYDESLERIFHALPYYESQKPGRELASCYNTIGTVYANTGEYAEALDYYKKARKVRVLINYNKGVGQSDNNIGEVYKDLHQYDSAEKFFKRSIALKRSSHDTSTLFNALNNLGEVAFLLGKKDDAVQFFNHALALSITFDNAEGKITALDNLALADLVSRDYTSAGERLDKALSIINTAHQRRHRKINLEYRERLSEETGDYRNALTISREIIATKDSLLDEEKANSLVRMQILYDSKNKEQSIQALQNERMLQNEKLNASQAWIISLIMAAVFLTTVSFLIYRQYLLSQRSKAKVDLLLRELNHRVKNSLQMLSGLFVLQAQQLTDTAALEAIRSSESRVNAMSLIHRKLYMTNGKHSIDMKEYLEELIGFLIQSYGYSKEKLAVNLRLSDVPLDVDKAIPLGLIVNELVSNAFKYSFPGRQDARLDISLSLQPNNGIVVEVADNGAGFDHDQQANSGSFGLSLVKMLIRDLRGTLKIQNLNGTHFSIDFPISTP